MDGDLWDFESGDFRYDMMRKNRKKNPNEAEGREEKTNRRRTREKTTTFSKQQTHVVGQEDLAELDDVRVQQPRVVDQLAADVLGEFGFLRLRRLRREGERGRRRRRRRRRKTDDEAKQSCRFGSSFFYDLRFSILCCRSILSVDMLPMALAERV